jgi:O-methyltransferase
VTDQSQDSAADAAYNGGWDRRRFGHLDGRDLARMTLSHVPLPEFTAHSVNRFRYQCRLLDQVAAVPGDVVECGVGKGRSLLLWAHALQEGPRRRLWGFDSFAGFPEPGPEDESPRRARKGEWAKATVASVQQMLLASGLSTEWTRANVTLVAGYFEDSLHKYTGDRIALLHVDADLYKSYQDVFAQLGPKLAAGGIVAVDEYMNTWEHYPFPGARKAVDEFIGKTGAVLERDEHFGKYYLRVPAEG